MRYGGENEVKSKLFEVDYDEKYLHFIMRKQKCSREIPRQLEKLICAVNTLAVSTADCERRLESNESNINGH